MEEIAVGNLRSALAYYEKQKIVEENTKKLLADPSAQIEENKNT